MTARLYGTPGAEILYFDAFEALEAEATETVEIEVWTVRPPRDHLPSTAHLLEWIAESDYEVTEGWYDHALDATRHPDALNAAETLLDLIADNIDFRMADKHVATQTYTWTGSDLDGEYVLTETVTTEP